MEQRLKAAPSSWSESSTSASNDREAVENPAAMKLRSQAVLTLHSKKAQLLIQGRNETTDKPGIVGLMQFGTLVKRLWFSAQKDDPYADWYLMQTLNNLELAKTEIESLCSEAAALLKATQGVTVAIAQTSEPVSIELKFANPYGYMGAYLLAHYDEYICTVLTAKHVGLMPRSEAERALRLAGRRVRRAFASPQGWKCCDVRRDDVMKNSERAVKALKLMGPIPPSVIKGEIRPRIAPDIGSP